MEGFGSLIYLRNIPFLNLNAMHHYISGAYHRLKEAERAKITEAVTLANANSAGGTIRLHFDKNCDLAVLDRAAEIFNLFSMNHTALQNSVLIYVSMQEKKFVILGGQGINQFVPEGFWDEMATNMTIYFKSNNFAKAMIEGVETVSKIIQKHVL